jgi:hypothetical protein
MTRKYIKEDKPYYWGKKVEEYFTLVVEGRSIKVKRMTRYDYNNKEKSIPEITWEMDDVPMNIEIHKQINKIKLHK